MNNYTDIHYIYDLDDPPSNISNTTSSMLNNHFYRKKLLLGDMSARRSVTTQPLTTVIVIASIFLFITMSITAATVVFCKKKNTVFVLNKSEQEDDYDLELEEIDDTDVDFVELNEDLELGRLEQYKEKKYEQEGYRRMVISAVVEHETPKRKPCDHQSESDVSRECSLPSESVMEILKQSPSGARTIECNGRRYLVCELPATSSACKHIHRSRSEANGIDIQPDMSSIQGETSALIPGIVCDGCNDPFLKITHSRSMSVLPTPRDRKPLTVSLSSDFQRSK